MGRNPKSFTEIGVAGEYDFRYGIRQDDYDPLLRGRNGMRLFKRMRDSDPTVGSILTIIETLARGARWTVAPHDDSSASVEAAETFSLILDEMDTSFDDYLSDAVTFLTFGFSLFEIVLRRREDGTYGVKKLGPRAQWTVDSFDVTREGDLLGVWQESHDWGRVYIPSSRLMHLKFTSAYGDPAGRSVLRNAYRSYVYVTHIQEYEAVAIERELNGLPIGRVPSEYLAEDASDSKKAFVNKFKQILSDVKKNRQGYVLIPSDVYEDVEGKPSAQQMVGFELLASRGTRDIDTRKVISGHQQDIARTVMADFLFLGANDRGSFALSKSKTDIFVKAISSFLKAIAYPVNKKLIPYVWEANGWPRETMPSLVFSGLSPVDVEALGNLVRSLGLAGAALFPNEDLTNATLEAAGLPAMPTGNVADSDRRRPRPSAAADDPEREDPRGRPSGTRAQQQATEDEDTATEDEEGDE